jgi:hypothetical protein
MKISNWLVSSFAVLLLVGCKSSHEASHSPSLTASSSTTEPYAGTNIFYQIDRGPGCAYFIRQADYEAWQMTGGTKVVVINGHFPPPTQPPSMPVVTQTLPRSVDYLSRRDMSLIDDTSR